MPTFSHNRLDVYKAALDFVTLAEDTATALPRRRAYMADQLRRAALSILLNIGEGAGEFAPLDKVRFYRMAKRSATECAALLDACETLNLGNGDVLRGSREVLYRIVSMLTALAVKISGAAAAGGGPREGGTGTATDAATGAGTGPDQIQRETDLDPDPPST